MTDKLEIITWLTISTWINDKDIKWEYKQYNKDWDIDKEISLALKEIKNILDSDFEWKWIESYSKLINKESKNNIFLEKDIMKFIKRRKINEEDFYIIQNLSNIKKIIFHTYHNFYTWNKDKSNTILSTQLENINKDEYKEMYNYICSFLEITEKYDWTTAWNLNSIFEKRKNSKL